MAGKLTDQYCRPVLIISQGTEQSKGSARSVNGINIVEAIRSCSDILVNCGGHPAAAGFTIETSKIEKFETRLSDWLENKITDEHLVPVLKIDTQLDLDQINFDTLNLISKFEPFGMSNPQPVFLTKGLKVKNQKLLGAEGKHFKLILNNALEALGFGMGDRYSELKSGQRIDIVYTLNLDNWNGNSKVVLKLKDFRVQTV